MKWNSFVDLPQCFGKDNKEFWIKHINLWSNDFNYAYEHKYFFYEKYFKKKLNYKNLMPRYAACKMLVIASKFGYALEIASHTPFLEYNWDW